MRQRHEADGPRKQAANLSADAARGGIEGDKRPWSRPTIRIMELRRTGSGTYEARQLENAAYVPYS